MIHDTILDTIGRTPIVKLHRLPPKHVDLYVKVEAFNPGGSVKDRLANAIVLAKNGQTILTRDVDLQSGQAELTLIATPQMAGTLDIDAYLFGRDAQPVADHRLLFIQPADGLKIETTADAAVYKPGSDARVHFHVTNSRGEGVSAALGLQVVDEAVFALAEKQPGFAKVFFYLEQEVMKPRYEIHSLSLSSAIEPAENSRGDQVCSRSGSRASTKADWEPEELC